MVIRTELKNQAKEQIKGNIGIIFLCNIIVYGIGILLGLIPIVGYIGSIIVTPVLTYGLHFIYLGITKNNKAEVNMIFKGFDHFDRNFCIGFLQKILIFLWTLLLVIPGIIKGLSYSMCYFVAVDKPELSAMGTIRESEKIMDGHKMDLFVLGLSFIPWLLLVGITFGIASIYVMPYMQTTIANFYNTIKEEAKIYS